MTEREMTISPDGAVSGGGAPECGVVPSVCGPADALNGRHSDWTVARRRGVGVSASALYKRARAYCAAAEAVGNPAVAIYNPDGTEFAAALIGALHAGKKVYLPGDTLASTCSALNALDVAFVGSFSDEWRPIREPPAIATAELTGPAVVELGLGVLGARRSELVIFTSGTTGMPQALPKRLSQLLAEVETLERMFGPQLMGCDVLATVSHQHIYGLLFKILWPLVARRTFVSESIEFPEELIMHLSRHRAAVISGPAQLKRLPVNLDWDLVRLRVGAVFSSGGPLSDVASAAAEATLGCAPIEIYGSSETGGIAWRRRVNGIGELWTPLRGVRVRDADGRLAVRSRHLPDLPDGEWYIGDDSITMGNDGTFLLHGRTDRIVKIEGKRVSLAAIEATLTGSELVGEARVVALSNGDPSARDTLGAAIVPSESGWALLRHNDVRALRRSLETLLAEAIERIAIPRRWCWIDELPVNAAGKTTSDALARLFVPKSINMPAAHPLELSADCASLEIYVSPQLDCLDGHFERIAVLPGAAQLDWAVTLGRRYFRMTEPFVRLEAVKFHQLYTPGSLLSLTLHWAATRNTLSFRFSSSEGFHSSGRIYFGC